MWDWLINLLSGHIVDYILAALVLFMGWRWARLKVLISEITDLLESIDTALTDDKLNSDEIKKIATEFAHVLAAIKGMMAQVKSSWL